MSPDGILLIDKPAGVTSHDVVDEVRQRLGVRKVGHAGTLDPMATGLLVLGVGAATRLLRFLGDLDKEYEGTARLGVETDTLDADGRVVRESEVRASREEVRAAAAELTGEIDQEPPAYSAVKVGGRKLYEAARRGESLRAPTRRVRIASFEITGFEPPDVSFRVICSSGTYVRVLLADLGSRLGCGAHLTRLVRTRTGHLRLAEAASPADPGSPLPLEMAVAHLPRVDVGSEEAAAARHGRPLAPAGVAGRHAVFDPDGRLVGVYRDEGARARPEVVLP